jgi:type I restriction enzyme R subunit
MKLIATYTEATPGKQSMTRDQLIGLIQADAKFVDEREDIAAYIKTLSTGEGLSENVIRQGYKQFKADKSAQELAAIATQHGLDTLAVQHFVDNIMQRMIFDGEQLSELLAPLGLGWKARTQKELALMDSLAPMLHKLAKGREISGLSAYEQ